MSDEVSSQCLTMTSERVTGRLEAETAKRLDNLAARRKQTTSELIREAPRPLINDEDDRTESAYEAAQRAGIIGMARGCRKT